MAMNIVCDNVTCTCTRLAFVVPVSRWVRRAKMNLKRNTIVIFFALMAILVIVVYRSGRNGGTLVCAFTTKYVM